MSQPRVLILPSTNIGQGAEPNRTPLPPYELTLAKVRSGCRKTKTRFKGDTYIHPSFIPALYPLEVGGDMIPTHVVSLLEVSCPHIRRTSWVMKVIKLFRIVIIKTAGISKRGASNSRNNRHRQQHVRRTLNKRAC